MPATAHPFANGTVLLERQDWLATIVLNRPEKHNAMSLAMWQGLAQAVATVAEEDAVRAVVVRGAGRSFCAGADIAEFEASYATPEAAQQTNRVIREAQRALHDLARPTIAAIEGACVGGGCGIALSCDLRFSALTGRFGITPARLGLVYGLVDTLRLVETVGSAAAKDLLFSARIIEADEAFRLRLVDRLCPPEHLDTAVLDFARTLADLSQHSIRSAKALANAAGDQLAKALSTAFDEPFDGTLQTADFAEGRRAFAERRPPRFREVPDER